MLVTRGIVWNWVKQKLRSVFGLSPTAGASGPSIGSVSGVVGASRITFPNSDATVGPHAIDVVNTSYVGVSAPCLHVGYNQSAGGTNIKSGENGLTYAIEGNYNDGSGHNKMEVYVQYLSANGSVTKRPFFFQFQKDSDALVGSTIMGGSSGLGITSDDGTVAGAVFATFAPQSFTLAGSASADSVIKIDAGAGHTGNLWIGFNGTSGYAKLTPSTNKLVVNVNTRDIISFYATPIGANGAAIAVGVDDNGAAGTFDCAPSANGVKALVARAKSSTTVNTFEVQDSTSAVNFGVNKAGLEQLGGVSGAAGTTCRLSKTITGMADATDVTLFTISVPNVLAGAMVRVTLHGTLGDGDSTDSAIYNISVSRIAGANAKAVAGAKTGAGATTGATGNAAVIITVPAVSGAVGASNTFAVTARVTRSAGSSSNHFVTAEVEVLNGAAGGVTIS